MKYRKAIPKLMR